MNHWWTCTEHICAYAENTKTTLNLSALNFKIFPWPTYECDCLHYKKNVLSHILMQLLCKSTYTNTDPHADQLCTAAMQRDSSG